MEKRDLVDILDVTVGLFKTAKRLKKKYGKYAGVKEAIYGIEAAAIENMCGTANKNAWEYVDGYYKGLIKIEELIDHLAYPLKKDDDEWEEQ